LAAAVATPFVCHYAMLFADDDADADVSLLFMLP